MRWSNAANAKPQLTRERRLADQQQQRERDLGIRLGVRQ
jgi:hypothetical protein